jgi:glycine/D-amino acid oxidase-like deaminating enzyme
MGQLYHPEIYDVTRPVPSYWEATAPPPGFTAEALAGEEACEVAVIGGGFTGLSTALHLARDHGIEVRLLEAGHLGWGASGRNGGFCCMPAAKMSLTRMIKIFGLAETKRFFAAQIEGCDLVRSLGEDEAIDFELAGDGNLEVAHDPRAFDGLKTYGESLSRLFGIETEVMSSKAFQERGHGSREQFGALWTAPGFALNPLSFARGLAEAALRHGARLHPHSAVLAWEKAPRGGHLLTTEGGRLTAKKVVFATNGFCPEGLNPAFDRRLLPALSNIITTRPLSDDELSAQGWQADTPMTFTPVCNTRTLLFYYRLLPDRSFLFGARGDTTGSPEDGQRMKAWMTRRLGEVFPAWQDVPISHFWRGLVGVTRKLTPSMGRLEDDESVWYGYGYHANGVNTAPWVGKELAAMIAGKKDPKTAIPAVMAGQAAPFPLAALRLWVLRAAYLYYRVTDRLVL